MIKVPYYRHSLGDAELSSLRKTFNSPFLTTGPRVAEFEEKFSSYLGYGFRRPDVVAVNSCTNALHLAIKLFQSKPGKKIITTPLSFVATANAILYAGAEPDFVDIDVTTGLIDINLVEQRLETLGENCAGVVPVHLYGQMVDMARLSTITKNFGNVFIIEDSAHCIDGYRNGQRPGEYSDAACFSFHALKTMTCGEGGAIALWNHSGQKIEELKRLRLHGLSKGPVERRSNYSIPEMVALGHKYNMSDIQAAILLPQIDFLEDRRKKREAIAKKYQQAFSGEKNIGLLDLEDKVISSFSQFVILVDKRRRLKILNDIRSSGVEAIVSYPAIHLMPYYRKRFGFKEGMFPNAEHLAASNIALPIYPGLTDQECDYVIEKVIETVNKY